jgi:hypothetical protein
VALVNASLRFFSRGAEEGARRNAARACAALAERTRERREVEEWLALHTGQALSTPTGQPGDPPRETPATAISNEHR